jgi:hypothetical protein
MLSHDMKGKESQLKELQSKLESGEGCKYSLLLLISTLSQSAEPKEFPTRCCLCNSGFD